MQKMLRRVVVCTVVIGALAVPAGPGLASSELTGRVQSSSTAVLTPDALAGGSKLGTALARSQGGQAPDAAIGQNPSPSAYSLEASARSAWDEGGPSTTAIVEWTVRGDVAPTSFTVAVEPDGLKLRLPSNARRVEIPNLATGYTRQFSVSLESSTGTRADADISLLLEPVHRFSGADRYATSAEVFRLVTPGRGHGVSVASGTNFPDALAVGGSGVSDGLMLLTRRDALPSPIRSAIVDQEQSLDFRVIGGTGAISDRLMRELSDLRTGLYPVRRTAGGDRYATAVAVAMSRFDSGSNPEVCYLASGQTFPDALALGSLSSPYNNQGPGALGPVLLTRQLSTPQVTLEALGQMECERIVVVGGTAAISRAQELALVSQSTTGVVERVSGVDRFDTAAKLARAYPTGRTVFVVSGLDYPDALNASAWTSSSAIEPLWGSPILLTRPDRLPGVTRAELERLRPDRIIVLGGTTAVSRAVQDELNTLVSPPTPP